MSTAGDATTRAVWSGPTPYTEETLCSGNGYIVEGVLRDVRMHLVQGTAKPTTTTTTQPMPTRFMVITVDVSRVCRRTFRDGSEVMPGQTTSHILTKGYLTREKSVERSKDECTGDAAHSELSAVCNRRGFAPETDALRTKVHPSVRGRFEFWADAAKCVQSDFVRGMQLRLKTKGDSPVVETVTRTDDGSEKECLAYYSGEQKLGDSWTDRIAREKSKQQQSAAAAKTAPTTGAKAEEKTTEDSEWD